MIKSNSFHPLTMEIKCGVDIVYIPEFESNFNLSKGGLLLRCFHENEHKNKKINSLAGIFSAKEAVIKALELEIGSWLDIHIDYKDNGKPFVEVKNLNIKILSQNLSISHSNEYAISQYIALIE